jgi:hypothetical protein
MEIGEDERRVGVWKIYLSFRELMIDWNRGAWQDIFLSVESWYLFPLLY